MFDDTSWKGAVTAVLLGTVFCCEDGDTPPITAPNGGLFNHVETMGSTGSVVLFPST